MHCRGFFFFPCLFVCTLHRRFESDACFSAAICCYQLEHSRGVAVFWQCVAAPAGTERRGGFLKIQKSPAPGDTNNGHEIVGSEGPSGAARGLGFSAVRLASFESPGLRRPFGEDVLQQGGAFYFFIFFYGIYSQITALSHFYEPSRILPSESLTARHFL